MTTVLTVCLQIALAATSGAQDSVAWSSQDIGATRTGGKAMHDEKEMTWTVGGAGRGIYGAADSFHYMYQPFTGDGWISAKVESISEGNPWAKAGVMIRETLDPGSRCAIVYATPLNGVSVQVRPTTGGIPSSDDSDRTPEQKAMKVPVWIKLERRGDCFRAYFAPDDSDPDWRPVTWKPAAVAMSKVAYIGLAVTSHLTGVLRQARYSNVTIHKAVKGEIADFEILESPIQSRRKAYENLERLGNWRKDAKTMRNHGSLIANSLFAIGRTTELTRESTDEVLPNYYRVAELFPDSPLAVQALVRIAILDGKMGLQYGAKHLETKPREDQDMFYLGVLKGHLNMAETPEREAAVRSFVQHVKSTSNLRLIERAIAAFRDSKHAPSVYRNLIEHSMAQPSDERMAVTGLRYMALKLRGKEGNNLIHELASWAATQFKDTRLATCAMAVLADTYYRQGLYVEAVEAFQPELLSASQLESKTVEDIEGVLAAYRANTLLQSTVDPARIYRALGERAAGLGRNVVALHCQRKVAEAKGLLPDDFERSALKGVKYCESSPENEVWFWKGLLTAADGDLGTAAAAYERFVQGDGKSVLASRAYYDIARAKMANGEDAKEWIARAKALSPCNAVIQLERRLGAADDR